MMTGLIKGVGVTELNSNIGCFEMTIKPPNVTTYTNVKQ